MYQRNSLAAQLAAETAAKAMIKAKRNRGFGVGT